MSQRMLNRMKRVVIRKRQSGRQYCHYGSIDIADYDPDALRQWLVDLYARIAVPMPQYDPDTEHGQDIDIADYTATELLKCLRRANAKADYQYAVSYEATIPRQRGGIRDYCNNTEHGYDRPFKLVSVEQGNKELIEKWDAYRHGGTPK